MSSNSSTQAAPPTTTTTAAATTTTTSAPQQPNNPRPPPPPASQHHHHPHQRPPSPPPPVSPITPPLNPTLVAPGERERGRPTQLTHHTQTPQTVENAAAPPPPQPLDFDTNPDVLALRSAIAVLQNQRRRAAADMVALDRAKNAALADPAAFLRDLAGGRVGVGGDSLFGPGAAGGGGGDSESESDLDSESEDADADADADVDVEMGDTAGLQAKAVTGAEAPPPPQPSSSTRRKEPRVKKRSSPEPEGGKRRPPPPWSALPGKQNVVRCPPINWAQYAVVGESLDRLHSEQQRRPAQGAPAVVGPDGRFEFAAEGAGNTGEPYLGVAAPYSPLRDRVDRGDRKRSAKGSSSSGAATRR
ncbi:hypothetical protein DL767_002079 [Monosporascus sp. MG133]|nr:hypothetical protein DL767_002079 [Monosporascus sp. MG133]